MTNPYRAMCSELIEAIDSETADWEDIEELKARARALLAQPVAKGPADGEVGELVAWLRAFANGERHEGRPATSQSLARTADLLERFASPSCLTIDPGKEALAASIAANLAGPVRLAEMEPADGAVLVPAAQPVAVGLTDKQSLDLSEDDIDDLFHMAVAAQAAGTFPSDAMISQLTDNYGWDEDEKRHCLAAARISLAFWGRPTPQPVAVSERWPEFSDCDPQERVWAWNPVLDHWKLSRINRSVHTHWLPANALPTPAQ